MKVLELCKSRVMCVRVGTRGGDGLMSLFPSLELCATAVKHRLGLRTNM